MSRRPPRPTRTDTRLPYTTLFRSRGRHDNHLFIAAPSDSLSGEGHLPRPPEDDVVAEVLAALGRPDQDHSALEVDPMALAVADLRDGDRKSTRLNSSH